MSLLPTDERDHNHAGRSQTFETLQHWLPMPLRAIARLKKIFRNRAAVSYPWLIDHLRDVYGNDRPQIERLLDDLALNGYIVIRGHGRGARVAGGHNIDTLALNAVGVRVPYDEAQRRERRVRALTVTPS